jgi:hypothetical protein
MALTIGQIAAVSYPAVLAEMRKPANQWAESAFMRELERQGAIKKISLGPTIEAPLDFKRNPGTDFLATDMTSTSLSKTEVIGTASYTVAQLSVPVVWSKLDEVQNPSENQKVALVRGLLENGINSHDDAIEEALFAATATDGFNSLTVLFPDSGQGTVGGIDSATETWWRHNATTYTGSSDIEASLTTAWNAAAKGSGATSVPTMLVSGATAQAQFEGTQQALQRYVDSQEVKAGFKVLAFKTARYVFSQYGGTPVFCLNPKTTQVVVSKEYFRDKGDTSEIQNANAFGFKIYSALQFLTLNKSRNSKIKI